MRRPLLDLLRDWSGLARAGQIAIIGAIIAGGGVLTTTVIRPDLLPVGGGPEVASAWIDSTPGTCELLVPPAGYDDAKSCTRDGAEVHFAPDRAIGLKGGTYTGGWNIERVAGLDNLSPGCDPYGEWGPVETVDCVRIFVAPGDTVTFTAGVLEIMSSGIWIDGERTSGTWPTLSPTYNWKVRGSVTILSQDPPSDTDHVVVDGVNATDLITGGADHAMYRRSDAGGFTMQGFELCNPTCFSYTDEDGNPAAAGESKMQARNGFNDRSIVWDEIYVHDINITNGDNHNGGLFCVSGDGITIRESIWSQVWVYAIIVQDFAGAGFGPCKNVTIENSWFGCGVEPIRDFGNDTTCSGQGDIQFDTNTFPNWLIRFNSFNNATRAASCITGPGTCSYSNVRFIGNTGISPSNGTSDPCGAAGVTFDDNGWTNMTCAAGDTDLTETATQLFANANVGAEDLHLLNGTNGANNLVTGATSDYALGADIDAQARSGAPRDAGSDER